ncbi:hypothetical protein [Flavobacterium caeni]|uniref:Uncharacterized protein n=1 Tax=Flavobacterium caeni TaxID=490189 RepID=A0A1G5K1K8_9FLAO|nr:hypothetical protein [Flavobacterium caeni]SCY94344.1 hypothetical protein SAMN02927903_03021 [Flavobacterium caeni]
MNIIQFQSYQLAVFQVEGGLHITIIPQIATTAEYVTNDSILKEKLVSLFKDCRDALPLHRSIREVASAFDQNQTIFIAIVK